MEHLRIAGAALGLAGFITLWYIHFHSSKKRLRNFDWLLGSSLSLVLVLLGLLPDILDNFLGFFSFEKGNGERLIGLLTFSNLVAYLLIYVILTRNNRIESTLDRLVRELAKKEFKQTYGSSQAPLYIVIPAYNEAENIGVVLAQIPNQVLGLKTKTLVVVDGATDHTVEVVKQFNQAAVSYTINRGGGSALKAGYELALEAGAEIIVTLDADGQHLPEEIPNLVKPILDGEADLVNGSRVLGHYEKDSQVRAAGVVIFNWLVSFLTMTRITDCSNAFRAVRADKLAELRLRQAQFHTSELLIKALKQGYRVKEVPITIRRRLSGETKKPPSLKYGWGFAKAIINAWLW